jgi:hypothetical protein
LGNKGGIMSITIEISDNAAKFLTQLNKHIQKQDNRATASPYYFVVCTKREIATIPGSTGIERYYYDGSNFTKDELREYCDENELSFDDIAKIPYDVMEI